MDGHYYHVFCLYFSLSLGKKWRDSEIDDENRRGVVCISTRVNTMQSYRSRAFPTGLFIAFSMFGWTVGPSSPFSVFCFIFIPETKWRGKEKGRCAEWWGVHPCMHTRSNISVYGSRSSEIRKREFGMKTGRSKWTYFSHKHGGGGRMCPRMNRMGK